LEIEALEMEKEVEIYGEGRKGNDSGRACCYLTHTPEAVEFGAVLKNERK
jgi:hypothetical protein